MKRLYEALFLGFAVLALAQSSGIWFLGIFFLLWIAVGFALHRQKKTPNYKKAVAYAMILPFALWWFLSPNTRGHFFSPWLFVIPSWYFMSLAILQWQSSGKGGFPVFFRFNALFALLFSLHATDKISASFLFASAVFLLFSIKPKGRNFLFAISILLSVAAGIGLLFGFQKAADWQRHRMRSGNWEEKYRNERSMMGFSPVGYLGSFKTNFLSGKNQEIVLRLWTKNPPEYLRAIAYGDYSFGIWNLPKNQKWILPDFYIGDHAVFLAQDSAEPVWIKASLNTFDFAFAPLGSGIAYKDADSLLFYAGGSFSAPQENRNDWYYIPGQKMAMEDTAEFLNVPKRLDSLFAQATDSLNLKIFPSPAQKAAVIQDYFAKNFTYSLEVPFAANRKRDPLISFFENRIGFCEYYASFATLLLRKNGVPARYVVGFAFPEKTKEYAFFRRNRSHAWVEFFDGNSWQTWDPTPPILFQETAFSAWESWSERWKAKTLYLFHLLKDGTWRAALDSWTVFLEKEIQRPTIYLLLLLLLALACRKRIRQLWRRNQTDRPQSARIIHLQKLLSKTEKKLRHLGYRRKDGETVCAFYRRISKVPPPKPNPNWNALLENLQKYDAERWVE